MNCLSPNPFPKERGAKTILFVLCLLALCCIKVQAQEEETYADEDTASVITNDVYKQNPGWYLRKVDSTKIPTGILIDRVKFKSDMGMFNGKSRVKTCDYAVFRRIANHLQKAANNSVIIPKLDSVYDFAYQRMRWEQIYPIAILNYSFNKIRKKAFLNKLAEQTDTAMMLTSGYDSVFATRRCFLASPFNIRMHGDNIQVAFYKNMFFTNSSDSIISIEANFGNGWKTFNWDEPQSISFGAKTQYVEAKVRLTYTKNGDNKQRKAISHFTVLRTGTDLVPLASDVKTSNLKSTSVTPSTTLYYPESKIITRKICLQWDNGLTQIKKKKSANTEYQCLEWEMDYDYSKCDIEYNVLFHDKSLTKLRKPIIICDGFDPGDKTNYAQCFLQDPKEDDNWLRDERGLYQILNGDPSPFYKDNLLSNYDINNPNMIQALGNIGYDFVFVNFLDGAGDIGKNAYWYRRFLKEVVNGYLRDNQTEENIIIGPSMGGIISRLALDSAEQYYKEEHYVREWISFDVPNTGAYIPIGLQYAIYYLYCRADEHDKNDLKELINGKLYSLNTKAAKQMLLRHYSTMGTSEWNILSKYNVSETTSPSISPCSEYSDLYDNVLNKIGYPKLSRNIAISNGGTQLLYGDNESTQTTNFQKSVKVEIPEEKIASASAFGIQLFSISTPKITLASLPLSSNGFRTKAGRYKFFGGSLDDGEFFSTGDDYDLYATDIGGFDNAPGGWYYANHMYNASDENTEQPDKYQIQNRWANFINSASAFGLPVTAENIHKTWTQLQKDYKTQIPFDDTYGMLGDNEQHVRVSTATAKRMQRFLQEDLDTIQRPKIRINSALIQTISRPLKLKANKLLSFGSSNGLNKLQIKNGATLTIIAGNSIKFLPGTQCEKGAKLNAKIVAAAATKSALFDNTIAVSYPLISPYIGKVYKYDSNDELVNTVTECKLSDANIIVFPNPVSQTLFVKTNKADDIVLSVTNALGNCVYSKSYSINTNIEINISNLQNGLYFISVTGKNYSYKTKLIKK